VGLMGYLNVIQMVRDHLKANGYDGLVSDDWECGCELDDLAPCGEMRESFIAGHRVIPEDSDLDFGIVAGKRPTEGGE